MTEEGKEQVRRIDVLEELVSVIDMVDVIVYEHSAKRVEDRVSDGPDETERPEPEPQFQAMVRGFDGGLEARFRATYEHRDFVLLADLGVKYAETEPFQLAESLVPRFLSDIAIMGAFPYLRESLATSATRLGVAPPVLGLIGRGALTFSREPEGEGEPSADT